MKNIIINIKLIFLTAYIWFFLPHLRQELIEIASLDLVKENKRKKKWFKEYKKITKIL